MKFLILFLGLVIAQGCAGTKSARQVPVEASFARVALALKGCSSCGHCRTTIRQMTKGTADSNQVSLREGNLEVIYAEPRELPLRKTIDRLFKNQMHKLELVDVLLDVRGTVHRNASGQAFLTLEGTQQTFPLHWSQLLEDPPMDILVKVRTVVEGWQEGKDLTLQYKYVL